MEQIEYIKIAGQVCASCLSYLSLLSKPGISTLELDRKAEEFIRSNGCIPATIGYDGYKYSICISVNSQAVHCEPSNYIIKEGDEVKLDLVVDYNGWKADSAITVLIPPVLPAVRKLAENTYSALLDGIRACVEGNTVQNISQAVYAARSDPSIGVIKEFTGHGIGRDIHEPPQIPNFVSKDKNALLVAGMVVCVEPIFCLGDPAIYHKKGEWNTWMFSGQPVAHFEHTILITSGKPEILTLRKEEVGLWVL